MQVHTRAIAATLAAAAVLSLSACNGGGSSVNPFAPSRGTLRFINGSPDAANVGAVDVAIGTANQPNWTNIPYAGTAQNPSANSNPGITPYVQFNAPTQLIYIYRAGTSQQLTVPQTSINITPNGRTTIVLTGSVQHHNLRLVMFREHLFQTVAGAASVAFHHASQQFVTTKFSVGDQAAGTGSTTSCTANFAVIGTAIFGVSPPIFQEGLPPVSQTGIQFCAKPTTASWILTLRPSDVDATNTNNVMPFTGGASVNSDQNLSIYIIDGPLGAGRPKMVGVFDPVQ